MQGGKVKTGVGMAFPCNTPDVPTDVSLGHPPHPYENLSPFGLRNGALASYLLFSNTRSPSVAGACLVGAGSLLDSWLGDPAVSVRAGPPFVAGTVPPMVADDRGRLGTFSEYSSDSTTLFFRRCSSKRALRSASMLRFAKTYAPAPATQSDPHPNQKDLTVFILLLARRSVAVVYKVVLQKGADEQVVEGQK